MRPARRRLHPVRRGLAAGAIALAASLLGRGSPDAGAGPPPHQRVDRAGLTLVLIPAGDFLMGAGDGSSEAWKRHFWRSAPPEEQDLETERPRHPVRISKPFYLGAHEVTVGQFRKFVAATGYTTDAERGERGARGFKIHGDGDRGAGRFEYGATYTWKNPGFPQDDRHPVVNVSWKDAAAFCAWLSREEKATYRLPTEAEWEYACRAGTRTWLSFGDDPSVAHAYANLGDAALEKAQPGHVSRQRLVDPRKDPGDGYAYTSPVGAFMPNAFGLFDMHGNVWEWCQDRYRRLSYRQLNPKAPTVDPQGPETGDGAGDFRVLRGGSWYVDVVTARSSSRWWADSTDAFSYAGFRVLREL
jgi:sulfatase modifying factor 1